MVAEGSGTAVLLEGYQGIPPAGCKMPVGDLRQKVRTGDSDAGGSFYWIFLQ